MSGPRAPRISAPVSRRATLQPPRGMRVALTLTSPGFIGPEPLRDRLGFAQAVPLRMGDTGLEVAHGESAPAGTYFPRPVNSGGNSSASSRRREDQRLDIRELPQVRIANDALRVCHPGERVWHQARGLGGSWPLWRPLPSDPGRRGARPVRIWAGMLRATSYVVVFVGELELHRQGSSRTGSVLCWLANADSTCVHSPAIWISG
jgi:hypothetical protein